MPDVAGTEGWIVLATEAACWTTYLGRDGTASELLQPLELLFSGIFRCRVRTRDVLVSRTARHESSLGLYLRFLPLHPELRPDLPIISSNTVMSS